MDIFYKNVTNFFEEIFNDLKCEKNTKAYITSIFGNYKEPNFDLSKDNITATFAQAHHKQDFFSYQKIGDWIFFANTIAPKHLKFASKDYYDTIARSSYYSCYRLINRQWKLFEELADSFIQIEEDVKNKLKFIFNKSI